jgi:hypothetical protein
MASGAASGLGEVESQAFFASMDRFRASDKDGCLNELPLFGGSLSGWEDPQ